jgi:hypothetical protein
MKKTIIISIIFSIILSVGVLCIPKHEVPTNEEWEAFLEWEEEFFEWRDTVASDSCEYQIQHRDSHEVYFHGTLNECKDRVTEYELTKGECVIMPYLPF